MLCSGYPRQLGLARRSLPCFRPVSPEDSLFLPRCGHAMGSHFAFGGGQMGRLPNDHQSQRALGIDFSDRALCVFRRAIAGGAGRRHRDRKLQIPKRPPGRRLRSTNTPNRATRKNISQRKSDKTALKSSAAKKATFVADDTGNGSTAIPPSVANANAQLASAEPPAGSARAMSAKANTMLLAAADKPADTRSVAETQVVAADQLNDLDRALQESQARCANHCADPGDGIGRAALPPRLSWPAARKNPPGTRPR